MTFQKVERPSGPLPGSEPPAAGGFAASDNLRWTPTHQRWRSEYMAVFWTVQFALGCALVAVFFNDWSRTLAALGVG